MGDLPEDIDRTARRSVREYQVMRNHLPEFDPLIQLAPDDESVPCFLAVDVDLAVFERSDGSEQLLAVDGVRERQNWSLYYPTWRRLYVLTHDGEHVLVGDGDAMNGEVALAAVYHLGEPVAAYMEPQEPEPPDSEPLI